MEEEVEEVVVKVAGGTQNNGGGGVGQNGDRSNITLSNHGLKIKWYTAMGCGLTSGSGGIGGKRWRRRGAEIIYFQMYISDTTNVLGNKWCIYWKSIYRFYYYV